MLVKTLLGQFSLCIAHIEPISISAAAPTAPIKSAHMNSVNPAMFQIFQHNHHKNYQIRSFEAKSQLGNRNNHMITITTHKTQYNIGDLQQQPLHTTTVTHIL